MINGSYLECIDLPLTSCVVRQEDGYYFAVLNGNKLWTTTPFYVN
jgi:hypothetical protein